MTLVMATLKRMKNDKTIQMDLDIVTVVEQIFTVFQTTFETIVSLHSSAYLYDNKSFWQTVVFDVEVVASQLPRLWAILHYILI